MNMPWRFFRAYLWLHTRLCRAGQVLRKDSVLGLINFKEVKYLKDKYENLPQYLKDKAKFCLWKNEIGKGKVPYQVDGKRAKANNIYTFTDFKKALVVVDRFDGLGIGIFSRISAIDIDNCIDASDSYSDLAKDVMDIFKGSE